MRTAILIGAAFAVFIAGDALFNDARVARGIQHGFYDLMVGD